MNINVTARRRGYPIEVEFGADVPLLMTETETRFLVADLQRALEEIEGPFVQVVYQGGLNADRYTYRDPSGALRVGDTVEVQARGKLAFATVVKLGRGSFKGNILDVRAKIEKTVLAA